MIFVDTGAWFASIVPSDSEHQNAILWLTNNKQTLLTTDYVINVNGFISFIFMTLTEILPSLQKLSHLEKVKAIQFLATELAKDEQNSALLENEKTYEVWSPHNAFSAEKVLTDMLQQHLLQKDAKQ